jgi:hypothetical protein
MKPIMHLYSDKVTITDKRELMPLMKSSTIHVAASGKSGVIYTNVSKEALDEFIDKNMKIQSNLMLLKLAVDIAPEIKTVCTLRIADDHTVSIEETLKADVLMTNARKVVIIAEAGGKIYTNDAVAANQCVHDDIVNKEAPAFALKSLIDLQGGLVECELQPEV